MQITFFYKRLLTKIETKEDLINELHNLKDAYLRLKEQFSVRIFEEGALGKYEVTNFKRFALDALLKGEFILEHETDFILQDENFGKTQRYSTETLRALIPQNLNKRQICEQFLEGLSL